MYRCHGIDKAAHIHSVTIAARSFDCLVAVHTNAGRPGLSV